MYIFALLQMLIKINSAVASCWTVLVGFGQYVSAYYNQNSNPSLKPNVRLI